MSAYCWPPSRIEPCACGNRGCWEKYASETRVLRNILTAEPGDASDVEWISRRIAEGDDLQRIHNQLYSQVSHYREISLGHWAEILMPASLPFHKPGIIQLPIQKTSPDPSWLVFLYRQFDFAFLLGYNPSRFPKGVGIPSIVLLFFSCQ